MRIYIFFFLSLALTSYAENDALKQAVKNKYLRAECTSLEIGCSCIEGMDSEGNDIVKEYTGEQATLCFEYKPSQFAKAQLARKMKNEGKTDKQIERKFKQWVEFAKYDQEDRFLEYQIPRKM